MSRTGEVVLGIIGTLLNLFFTFVYGLMLFALTAVSTDAGAKRELESQVWRELRARGSSGAELEQQVQFSMNLVDSLGGIGWVFLACLVASTIAAIAAIILISKNRRPKRAGALFLIAAVLSILLLFPALFFLIAGVMAFTRKPVVSPGPPDRPLENGMGEDPLLYDPDDSARKPL